jgi:uncharacterized lipoprotein YmbA
MIATGSALACALLAGCAGQTPARYYRITPEPGRTEPATHGNIVLRPIITPGYLDQTGVPKPGGRQSFATFDNHLWAGSLAGLLQASLVQNLAQRLPAATVIGGGGAIDLPDSTIVEINVLNLAPSADGRISLDADVSIKPPTGANRQTRYIQLESTTGGPTAGQIVAAMSQVWGEFADRIAGAMGP